MNYLLLSVGRRGELLKDFRRSISAESKLVAADLSPYAPALYMADKQYLVPWIDETSYIDRILDICRIEQINAVTTFVDPKIEILAKNRKEFEKIGVEVLAPYEETAKICFDKYEMFKYLKEKGIKTVLTYGDIESFEEGIENGEIKFPVFCKTKDCKWISWSKKNQRNDFFEESHE